MTDYRSDPDNDPSGVSLIESVSYHWIQPEIGSKSHTQAHLQNHLGDRPGGRPGDESQSDSGGESKGESRIGAANPVYDSQV